MANGDNFWVVVENSDSCQTTSVSRTVTVSAPPAVVLTTSVDFPGDVFCTGEDVDFIATNIGGATYEYEVGSGGRVAVGSSSFTIPYAQLAGTATVTVYVTSGSVYRQTQSLYRRISYRVLEQLQGHRRFVLVTPQRILPVQRSVATHQELLLMYGSVKR